MNSMFVIVSFTVLCCVTYTQGHGRLMEPPQRSSIWRFNSSFPKNYNDNELFCGGVGVQWGELDGKCGTCGDPYNGVRENEAGGKYATGYIVRSYEAGQSIKVGVELTANHLGNFQFRLCPHNDPTTPVQQDCLDKHLLTISHSEGRTKYEPGDKVGWHEIYVDLPDGLTCSQCVFQWHYTSGNTWGCEDDTGYCCKGCGPQETFINCADISIHGDGEHITSTAGPSTSTTCQTTLAPTTPTETTATTQTPTAATTTSSTASPSSTNTDTPTQTTQTPTVFDCPDGYIVSCEGDTDHIVEYCNTHCSQGSPACTSDICACRCAKHSCNAIGAYADIPGMNAWCQDSCIYGCSNLSDRCECETD